MDITQVEFYEKIFAQLVQLHKEIGELSKKKPDDPINIFKIKFINEKLGEANRFLQGKHKPFSSFEVFEEASLPTNSDVVFILSQYIECLEGFRSENVEYSKYNWYWKTSGRGSKILTQKPTKFVREKDTYSS